MDYEEFRATFVDALTRSGLPTVGPYGQETLDLGTLIRTYDIYVMPAVPIPCPLHVTAEIKWLWWPLQTARSLTTEEQTVRELLGGERGREAKTERPWLNMQIQLSATARNGVPLPNPKPAAWAKWAREAVGRLEATERIVPEKETRKAAGGRVSVLAWQSDPQITLVCDSAGRLGLGAVSVRASQRIDLPRKWDGLARPSDPHPRKALDAMFARLKAALHAWGEVMDHLG
jgi:hypothetical protein